MTGAVDIRVLGTLEVRRGAEAVAIGGPKPRQILAMLVAARGRVVPADRLQEELWGDDQPADPGSVLQSNISRLRKLLSPDARIVARPPGYVLEIDSSGVDAWRFEASHVAARAATAPAALVESYERALDCFTGPPYAEFADRGWARADVLRLEEMRTVAREELLSARLALGEDRTVVADLEALVSEHPLRERPRHDLAVALHRSGRSADALRRIDAFHSILRDEVGLSPPAATRQLESRILESDPTLLGPPVPAAGAGNRRVEAFALTEVLWLEAREGSSRTALAGFAHVTDMWFRCGDWPNEWLSLRHVLGILVHVGDHRAAATLHGAITAIGAASALPFEASAAAHINDLVDHLRDEMHTAEFAAAVRRGASMTDGEIVEFVQERIHVLKA